MIQRDQQHQTVSPVNRSWLLFVFVLSVLQIQLASDPAKAFGCQSDPSAIEKISLGFQGKVLLGRWVPIRVYLSQETLANSSNSVVEIQALDGDAVPVVYRIPVNTTDGGNFVSGIVRIGRAAGITVRVTEIGLEETDGTKLGATVADPLQRRFALEELSETHSFLPSTTRVVLMPGIDQPMADRCLELEKASVDQVIAIRDWNDLPLDWMAFDSVTSIVFASPELNSKVPAKVATAIRDWVYNGGRILLTGGKGFHATFSDNSPLKELLPGESQEFKSTRDSGAVELLVGGVNADKLVQENGPALQVLPLSLSQAAFTTHVTARIGEQPLIVHRPFGFGRSSLIVLDFLSEPLSNWGGRSRLLSIAMMESGSTTQNDDDASAGRVSHIGYEDIAGQLRAGMDQFRRVAFVTFTTIALLITLFILLIGPGDFFFLRRVVGRMEWTWLTFTLLSLAFCGIAFAVAKWSKSAETEVNQVEFIDINAIDGNVRGSVWAHVYSPGTGNYDIQMTGHNKLIGKLDRNWLTWQGLPGSGLGAMQSRSDLGLYRRKYFLSPGSDKESTRLLNVPMQNASTKTLFGNWKAKFEKRVPSALRQSPTSDALLGVITNPLDVALTDCVVLYGEWVYVLEDRPLEAGDDIVVEDDLRERTVTGFFTREVRSGGDEAKAAWDPTSTSLTKVMQIMAFFDKIGGENYTQLTNQLHPTLDMTHHLEMGQAVLLGHITDATTPLSINGQEFTNYDKQLTMVRIVLPVKKRKSRQDQERTP